MKYQSFKDGEGASDSHGKLMALRLPNLKGKKVLDLGCNEGFFCIHAKGQGASEVTGIDFSESVIELARTRAKGMNINFSSEGWFSATGEHDVVLMLSALHYEQHPISPFKKIHSLLADDGLFILECGIALKLHHHRNSIASQQRHDGVRFYPDIDTLTKVWLKNFSFRIVSESVDQRGDELKRYVLHCQKKKTSVVFIVGEPGKGKTNMAADIHAEVTISTDLLLIDKTGKLNIAETWEQIKFEQRDQCIQMIADAINMNEGASTIVVEGYVLNDVWAEVNSLLWGGFHCWTLQRQR